MFSITNSFLILKKIISTIMVAILSLGYNLGMSFDIQGVYKNQDSALTYSFYDSTRKVQKGEMIDKVPSYNICLARDEYEACQIVVRSKFCSTVKYAEIEFTPFVNDRGEVLESNIFRENYTFCVSNKDYGTHPDALIPLQRNEAYSFRPLHEINHPFYIQVHSTPETRAGTYKAQVKARYDDRKDLEFSAEVTATVWDFTLPEKPYSASALGIGKGDIAQYYKLEDENEKTLMYKKYYDFLLERNMSGYDLPYDILDPRADSYMSDPRVTSFIVPFCKDDDELLIKYYAKVQSNPEWAEKAVFYPVDEPDSPEAYVYYNKCTDRLQRLCPGYHMVTPSNAIKVDGVYSTVLQNKSDIFCGLSSIYADEGLRQSAEQRRKEGADIWWYVCGGPREDYCNIFVHWEGIKGRLLFWQQKSLDINGFLYWSTTYWSCVDGSPWKGSHTTPWTGPDTFGDGSLFYTGPEGPYSSLRLEELADGFDDFDLLSIAERLFGRNYIDKKIAKVSRNLTDYTHDDSLLMRVRNEIGFDIEKALKG